MFKRKKHVAPPPKPPPASVPQRRAPKLSISDCLQQAQGALRKLRAINPGDLQAFPLLNEIQRLVQQLKDATASLPPADREAWSFQIADLEDEFRELADVVVSRADSAPRPEPRLASPSIFSPTSAGARTSVASTPLAPSSSGRVQQAAALFGRQDGFTNGSPAVPPAGLRRVHIPQMQPLQQPHLQQQHLQHHQLQQQHLQQQFLQQHAQQQFLRQQQQQQQPQAFTPASTPPAPNASPYSNNLTDEDRELLAQKQHVLLQKHQRYLEQQRMAQEQQPQGSQDTGVARTASNGISQGQAWPAVALQQQQSVIAHQQAAEQQARQLQLLCQEQQRKGPPSEYSSVQATPHAYSADVSQSASAALSPAWSTTGIQGPAAGPRNMVAAATGPAPSWPNGVGGDSAGGAAHMQHPQGPHQRAQQEPPQQRRMEGVAGRSEEDDLFSGLDIVPEDEQHALEQARQAEVAATQQAQARAQQQASAMEPEDAGTSAASQGGLGPERRSASGFRPTGHSTSHQTYPGSLSRALADAAPVLLQVPSVTSTLAAGGAMYGGTPENDVSTSSQQNQQQQYPLRHQQEWQQQGQFAQQPSVSEPSWQQQQPAQPALQRQLQQQEQYDVSTPDASSYSTRAPSPSHSQHGRGGMSMQLSPFSQAATGSGIAAVSSSASLVAYPIRKKTSHVKLGSGVEGEAGVQGRPQAAMAPPAVSAAVQSLPMRDVETTAAAVDAVEARTVAMSQQESRHQADLAQQAAWALQQQQLVDRSPSGTQHQTAMPQHSHAAPAAAPHHPYNASGSQTQWLHQGLQHLQNSMLQIQQERQQANDGYLANGSEAAAQSRGLSQGQRQLPQQPQLAQDLLAQVEQPRQQELQPQVQAPTHSPYPQQHYQQQYQQQQHAYAEHREHSQPQHQPAYSEPREHVGNGGQSLTARHGAPGPASSLSGAAAVTTSIPQAPGIAESEHAASNAAGLSASTSGYFTGPAPGGAPAAGPPTGGYSRWLLKRTNSSHSAADAAAPALSVQGNPTQAASVAPPQVSPSPAAGASAGGPRPPSAAGSASYHLPYTAVFMQNTYGPPSPAPPLASASGPSSAPPGPTMELASSSTGAAAVASTPFAVATPLPPPHTSYTPVGAAAAAAAHTMSPVGTPSLPLPSNTLRSRSRGLASCGGGGGGGGVSSGGMGSDPAASLPAVASLPSVSDLEAFLDSITGPVDSCRSAAEQRARQMVMALAGALSQAQKVEASVQQQRRAVKAALAGVTASIGQLEADQATAAEGEDFYTAAALDEQLTQLSYRRTQLDEQARLLAEALQRAAALRLDVLGRQAEAWRVTGEYLARLQGGQQQMAAALASQADREAQAATMLHRAALETLGQRRAALEERDAELEEAYAEVAAKIAAATAPAEAERQRRASSRDALQAEVESLRALLAAKEAALAQAEAEVAEVADVVRQQAAAYDNDMACLDEARGMLEAEAAQVAGQEQAVQESERQAAIRAAAVEEHQSQLRLQADALGTAAGAMQCEAEALALRVASEARSQEQRERLLQADESARDELKGLERCIADLSSDLSRLAEQRGRLAAERTAAQEVLGGMQRSLPELEAAKRAAAANKDFREAARLSGELRALSAQADVAAAQLARVSGALSELAAAESGKVSELEDLRAMIHEAQRHAAEAHHRHLVFCLGLSRAGLEEAIASELYEEAGALQAEVAAEEAEALVLERTWGFTRPMAASQAAAAAAARRRTSLEVAAAATAAAATGPQPSPTPAQFHRQSIGNLSAQPSRSLSAQYQQLLPSPHMASGGSGSKASFPGPNDPGPYAAAVYPTILAAAYQSSPSPGPSGGGTGGGSAVLGPSVARSAPAEGAFAAAAAAVAATALSASGDVGAVAAVEEALGRRSNEHLQPRLPQPTAHIRSYGPRSHRASLEGLPQAPTSSMHHHPLAAPAETGATGATSGPFPELEAPYAPRGMTQPGDTSYAGVSRLPLPVRERIGLVRDANSARAAAMPATAAAPSALIVAAPQRPPVYDDRTATASEGTESGGGASSGSVASPVMGPMGPGLHAEAPDRTGEAEGEQAGHVPRYDDNGSDSDPAAGAPLLAVPVHSAGESGYHQGPVVVPVVVLQSNPVYYEEPEPFSPGSDEAEKELQNGDGQAAPWAHASVEGAAAQAGSAATEGLMAAEGASGHQQHPGAVYGEGGRAGEARGEDEVAAADIGTGGHAR